MPRWQKNLYVLFVAEMVSLIGMSVIFPFLSLYVDELDRSFGTTEFWAGLVFSAQFLTMVIAAPIWGSLADRYGRKVMVQRAMLGGAIILGLMAFARSAEQLVMLRAVQGIITGTVPAANTLVAASAPRERTGYAMGLMQMGIWIGASIGPLLGGVLADMYGFRPPFLVTAVCLLLAGVAVTLFVHEEFVPASSARFSGREIVGVWLGVLRIADMPRFFGIRLLVRMGQSIVVPFLPLFVATLLASQEVVSTLTGLIIGVTSATGALSSTYLGRLGDRVGHHRLLLICAFGAALAYAPMGLVRAPWQLVILYAMVGGALGGVVPAVTALMTHAAPVEKMGAVFGLDTSINSSGNAVAPLLGTAVIATAGLGSVFIVVAVIFVVVAGVASTYHPAPLAQSTGQCVAQSRG